MSEKEAKDIIETVHFLKRLAQIIMVIFLIILVMSLISCKAKKTITKSETKEEIEATTVEELFAGSEREKELETTRTEDRIDEELEGTIPFNWNEWMMGGQDSTGFKIKSKGTEVEISVTDDQIIVKSKSEATTKSTETTKVKEQERDTTVSKKDEKTTTKKKEKIKTKEKSKPIWMYALGIPAILLLIGFLYYKLRR